jgi:hypothetical protein
VVTLMTRSTVPSKPGDAPAEPPLDPVVTLLREHTEIQMLAGRMHEIADAARRNEAGVAAELREGLLVHRRFVASLHEQKEGLLAETIGADLDAPSRAALGACAAEHPRSIRFEQEAENRLGEGRLAPPSLKALAKLFDAEADRLVDHHRSEIETFYRPMRTTLSTSARARLKAAFVAFEGDAAAAQARLTAWASKAHASAD